MKVDHSRFVGTLAAAMVACLCATAAAGATGTAEMDEPNQTAADAQAAAEIPAAAGAVITAQQQGEVTPVVVAAPSTTTGEVTVTLDPASATRTQLGDDVLWIVATGLQPGESVRFFLAGPGGAPNDLTEASEIDADATGRAETVLWLEDPSFAAAGTYTATVLGERSGRSGTGSLHVQDSPTLPPSGSGSVTAVPVRQTRTAAAHSGVDATLGGFQPGEEVEVSVVLPLGDRRPIDTVTADSSGSASTHLWFSGAALVGVYQVVAQGATSGYAYGSFVVQPDEDYPVTPAAGARVTLDPATTDTLRLAVEGVDVAATGFAAGEPIRLLATSPTGRVALLSPTTAAADGTVTGRYLDTSGRTTAGTYTVTVAGATSGRASAPLVVTDSTVVLDPQAAVTPGAVPQDLVGATPLHLDATGFLPGDTVSIQLFTADQTRLAAFDDATVGDDGSVHEDLLPPDPFLDLGTLRILVTGRSAGQASAFFTVTEPTGQPGTFAVTMSPASVSRAQLAAAGVVVTASGLGAGEAVALQVLDVHGTSAIVARGTADSAGSARLAWTPGPVLDEGTLTLTVRTARSRSVSATLVVDDAANPPAPSLDVAADQPRPRAAQFHRDGTVVSAGGLNAGEIVTVAVTVPGGQRAVVATLHADESGTLSYRLAAAAAHPPAGEYRVELQGDAGHYGETTITVRSDR